MFAVINGQNSEVSLKKTKKTSFNIYIYRPLFQNVPLLNFANLLRFIDTEMNGLLMLTKQIL